MMQSISNSDLWISSHFVKNQKKNRSGFLLGVVIILVIGVIGPRISWAQVSEISFPFTSATRPQGYANFNRLLTEGGIRLGSIILHPHLGLGSGYMDNAFRTETNREHDFVYVVSPGIQVQVPFAGRKHQFVVDYWATQLIYERFPENDGIFQKATGRLMFNFPSGLKMDLQGGHTTGIISRGAVLDVGAQEPTKWNTNTFIGSAETLGSWAGVRMTADFTDWNFENNDQAAPQDRNTYRANLTFFGSITPKTFALLDFDVEKSNYDKNIQNDNFQWGVNTGIRLSPTGKTTGEI